MRRSLAGRQSHARGGEAYRRGAKNPSSKATLVNSGSTLRRTVRLPSLHRGDTNVLAIATTSLKSTRAATTLSAWMTAICLARRPQPATSSTCRTTRMTSFVLTNCTSRTRQSALNSTAPSNSKTALTRPRCYR